MRFLHILAAVVSTLSALTAAPTASAQGTGTAKLFFEGDMVRGRPQAGATGPVCVLASQFKRNEQVVWRIRVLDQNGQSLDDKALKSLVVELPDGQKFAAKFGNHPPRGTPTDRFWAVSWVIPSDYPTGTLVYKVVATDLQGRTHTWEPFKIATSQLTVIPGTVEFAK